MSIAGSTVPLVSAWITGTGAVTCAGIGVEGLWKAARDSRSALQGGLGHVSTADVSRSLPGGAALAFALSASRQAMSAAGWQGLRPSDGLIVATTTGHITLWQRALPGFIRGQISAEAFSPIFRRQTLGSFLQDLRHSLGHQGPTTVVSSSCAAATQALGLATLWLKSKVVERCLVGGVEVLCDLTVEGFRCLQLLATTPSAPFDQARTGIHLSEGAAFLCLEAAPEKVDPLAQISGFGCSTDAHHMTGPHPEGSGSLQAMTAALQMAGLPAAGIDWVHAHGTGSAQNDLAEGAAISRLFDGSQGRPWVSSTKSVHGHALGASGAIETALCVEAIRHQIIPPTAGLERPDPRIDLRHATTPQATALRHILKNTLGFGGSNAALVLSDPKAAFTGGPGA